MGVAYDIAALDSKKQDPADWTHPVDLIEPIEDDDDPLDVEGIGTIPTGAITIILRLLITKPPRSSRDWGAITSRLAVLAKALDVADLGRRSLSDIADDLGVSRGLSIGCAL